jgi:hypothetical protein
MEDSEPPPWDFSDLPCDILQEVSGHLGFFDAHVFKCVSKEVREATSAACRWRCEARRAKMKDGVDDRIDARLSRLEPSPEGTIMSVCLSLFATGFAWGHLQVLSTAIDTCVLIDGDDGAALLRLARSIGRAFSFESDRVIGLLEDIAFFERRVQHPSNNETALHVRRVGRAFRRLPPRSLQGREPTGHDQQQQQHPRGGPDGCHALHPFLGGRTPASVPQPLTLTWPTICVNPKYIL